MGEARPPKMWTPEPWRKGSTACADLDTNLFYPDSPRPKEEYMAPIRRICFACPVRRECLSWAMRHEKYGIWAGLSEAERQSVIRVTCATCRWTLDPADLIGPRRVVNCRSCRERWKQKYEPEVTPSQLRRQGRLPEPVALPGDRARPAVKVSLPVEAAAG